MWLRPTSLFYKKLWWLGRSLMTGRIWNYAQLLKAGRRTWNCRLASFISVPGYIKSRILLESIPKCIKRIVRLSVQWTKGKSGLTKWLPSSVQWLAMWTRGWWCFLTLERFLTLFSTVFSFRKWTGGRSWIVNCLDIWAESMLNNGWTSSLQLDESSPAINNEVHIVHHLHQRPGDDKEYTLSKFRSSVISERVGDIINGRPWQLSRVLRKPLEKTHEFQ